MADEGTRRVEVRLSLSGRGISSTPERIAEMTEQAAKLQAKQRTPPTAAFSGVLERKTKGNKKERVPTAKEAKQASLPKMGPTPGLRHPAQRESMGRDDDAVVVKG